MIENQYLSDFIIGQYRGSFFTTISTARYQIQFFSGTILDKKGKSAWLKILKKSSKNCTHAYMKIGYSKTCGQNDETEDLFSFESNHGQIYFHFRKVQQTPLNDERLTDGNGRSSGILGRAFRFFSIARSF